jgi:hypothetical protein
MTRRHISDPWRLADLQRTASRQIMPCSLVYLDSGAAASPNWRGKDPTSYVRQAVCLNRSLLRAGMPRLNIYTNAVDTVHSVLAAVPEDARPVVHELETTHTALPKTTPFYAAHFKLDLMTQVAKRMPRDALFLLLDTDMVALRPLGRGIVDRAATLGAGVFDISDQVFPAYGSPRVIADLEIAAGRSLVNPRWYGGEFLLCTATFLQRLVDQARPCFRRYIDEIGHLNHHGDEAFISAALCLLVEQGQSVVEVGAYQAVGRHWPGNTHRNLYWFSRCEFLHLPGSKALIEREARYAEFDPARLWRALSYRHRLGQIRAAAKLLLQAFMRTPAPDIGEQPRQVRDARDAAGIIPGEGDASRTRNLQAESGRAGGR